MGSALGGCRRCDCYQLGRLDALTELGGARHNRPDSGTDTPTKVEPCCSDSVAWLKRGMQLAAFDTYTDNLAATAARDAAARERQTVARWHE